MNGRPLYQDDHASTEAWSQEAQRSTAWAQEARMDAKKRRRKENVIALLTLLLLVIIVGVLVTVIALTIADAASVSTLRLR